MEEIYSYATGKRGEHFGINYDAYGIIAFHNKGSARTELGRVLDFQKGLEGEVIDITPLVQTGIIRREKLRYRD